MSTSNDQSAEIFHDENDPDNEIEEGEENDESDATSDYESNESYGSFPGEVGPYEEIPENHSEEVYDFKRKELERLRNLGLNVNWEIKDERYEFFYQLYNVVKDWKIQLPDLRSIFQQDEMNFLLVQAVIFGIYLGEEFIEFVVRTGYKDRIDVPEEGKNPLLLRRTTAVHHAARYKFHNWEDLFKIFDRFDVNYVDESGLTHFHAACMSYRCQDSIPKFLEFGHDPNLIWPETGDSPLHLSVFQQYTKPTEILLRKGANPNLANKDGLTPLHMNGKRGVGDATVKLMFEICKDMKQPLQVNAQDNFGNTTLHLALKNGYIDTAKSLLRNGADPNLANNAGSTPLHIICQGNIDCGKAEALFEVTDEIDRLVQVNARDNLGRTPLQLAVLNLLPYTVEILLDRGADLSSFVLLPENDDSIEKIRHDKIAPAFAALAIYESLEKRGYEVDDYALITMKTFRLEIADPEHHYLIMTEHSANIETRWSKKKKLMSKLKTIIILPRVSSRSYNDFSEFERAKIETAMTPTLSLYDLMRLRPEEVEKVLTYRDYFKLIDFPEWSSLSDNYQCDALRHLYENVPRGFFRRWALKYFYDLIRYRLPILCCEIIIDQLRNEDLGNICFAATVQN